MANKRQSAQKKNDTVCHKDKRKNIPTEELRDFVREEENQPTKILYPRDTDLNPLDVYRNNRSVGCETCATATNKTGCKE